MDASSAAGRQAAAAARALLEQAGVAPSELLRCDDHEGSALAGMFKLRVPLEDAVGPWGMVLQPLRVERTVYFGFVAFGVRHPPEESQRWSVYERAHHRLNEDADVST